MIGCFYVFFDYTIVVPARDEAVSIERALARLVSFCEKQDETIEVIVVENGSTDQTWHLISLFAKQHRTVRALQSSPGKGAAILKGWQAAQAPIVLFIDADLSPSLDTLPHLYTSVKAFGGCAVADRFLAASSVERRIMRTACSRLWSSLVAATLPLPFMDYQCGAKACHQAHVGALAEWVQDRGWFFDLELLSWFYRKGLPIRRVPTSWEEHRFQERRSKLAVIQTGWMFLRRLLKLRRRFREHL